MDCNKINAHPVKDVYPLPTIHAIVDSMPGAKVFSILDLESGYWQLPVYPPYIQRIPFVCPLGLFEFTRMLFGICTSHFQGSVKQSNGFRVLVGKTLSNLRPLDLCILNNLHIFLGCSEAYIC